jgi:hypothetical protein
MAGDMHDPNAEVRPSTPLYEETDGPITQEVAEGILGPGKPVQDPIINPVDAVVVPRSHFEAMKADLELLRGRVANAHRENDEYRAHVREVALEVKAQMGWCDEGFNEAALRLGLEPLSHPFRVTVRVYAFQDVEIEIDAANEDAAREQALSDDVQERIWGVDGPGDGVIIPQGWETDSLNVPDVEVRHVEELGTGA